jgi:hypothetical protein
MNLPENLKHLIPKELQKFEWKKRDGFYFLREIGTLHFLIEDKFRKTWVYEFDRL